MKERTVKYMARTWLIIWISWVFYYVGTEFLAGWIIWKDGVVPGSSFEVAPWALLLPLLSFLVIELIGAFRKSDTGDTLSELNWNAQRNAKGRRPFTTALVLSVALRACTLPFLLFTDPVLDHWLLVYGPFLFMMLGFMITLAIHIWHSGKHG